jgi:hypothetical protein
MIKDDSKSITRRGFITGALRLGALAGLVAGSGWLITRPSADQSASTDGQCFSSDLPCRRCGVYQRCTLPRAEAARKFKE